MKLYTEEQVMKAMDLYVLPIRLLKSQVIEKLTPIELPSDEEIQNLIGFACKTPNTAINGAKWMRDKILNQNK